METIKEFNTELEKLKINLKKSKNRICTKKYIEEKLDRLEFFKNEVNKIISTGNEKEEEEQDLTTTKLEFDKLLEEIENILGNLKTKEEGSFTNMAQFDISMVGKNLQVFKGTYKFLDDFITQTELLHDLLKDEDKDIFIKYVYNFKLSAQVRSVLGRSNKPTTFHDLRKLLEESYPNPKTLQQVLTELGTTTQGNLNISEFREKISELSDQLSKFEIDNLKCPSVETKEAIYKASDSLALNIFMKGVNPEYKPILLANIPKNLNEATQRCVTAEQSLGLENKNLFKVNETTRSNNYNKNNGHNKNRNYYRQNNANGYYKNKNYQRDNNDSGDRKNGYNRNNNYQRHNNESGYNKNNNNNGYNQKFNNGNGYRQNQNNNANRFDNNQQRDYRAFPCTEQQENCEGRITETVIHEGQN